MIPDSKVVPILPLASDADTTSAQVPLMGRVVSVSDEWHEHRWVIPVPQGWDSQTVPSGPLPTYIDAFDGMRRTRKENGQDHPLPVPAAPRTDRSI